MKCATCPKVGGQCLGERVPHLCGRADYRDYLARYDDSAPMPGLMTMAGNLLSSAVGFALDPRLAPEEVQAGRLAICQACPNFLPDGTRCTLCGCYLWGKLALAGEACPDDPPRWPAA